MKKYLIGVLKKVLPQKAKSKLKVFIAYHPYVFNPVALLKKSELESQMTQILEENKGYKGVIICPPTIDWNTTLYQRPHQVARAFAQEGYLVFFCTNNIRFDNVKGFEKIENRLYLVNNTAVLRKVSESAIVIISWAINRFYADRFKGSYIVYEYMDELNVFDGEISDLVRDHNWLVEHADMVVATADKLYDEVKGKSKNAVLVPNGVDVSHFKRSSFTIPKDMKAIVEKGTPVVGYYGAIAEWFDYEMVFESAKQRPEWSFVLIGPTDYDKSYSKNKDSLDNVYFLGAKHYNELPNYGNLFSVATIPFKINEITESTSPIKLFEYMALGKPIVTTDMPECRKYRSVLIAKNQKEFVLQIEKALKFNKDKDYLKVEEKEANENSWQNRVRTIIEEIK